MKIKAFSPPCYGNQFVFVFWVFFFFLYPVMILLAIHSSACASYWQDQDKRASVLSSKSQEPGIRAVKTVLQCVSTGATVAR